MDEDNIDEKEQILSEDTKSDDDQETIDEVDDITSDNDAEEIEEEEDDFEEEDKEIVSEDDKDFASDVDDQQCIYKDDDSEEEDDVSEYFSDEEVEEESHVVPNEMRITKPYLTKYERVRLTGIRVKQLVEGAKPMIKNTEKLSATEVTNLEIEHGVIPLNIERPLPNGNIERWKVSELRR